jgi:CheY-like chemotaxis protein
MTTVLIADDDSQLRRFVRAAVEEEGDHTVLEAATGAEALRLALLERPDLAFIDVQMPDLDGFQVCGAIKADPVARSTRVVLFTGVADTDGLSQALAAGANAFVRKPLTAEQVRQQLRQP